MEGAPSERSCVLLGMTETKSTWVAAWRRKGRHQVLAVKTCSPSHGPPQAHTTGLNCRGGDANRQWGFGEKRKAWKCCWGGRGDEEKGTREKLSRVSRKLSENEAEEYRWEMRRD